MGETETAFQGTLSGMIHLKVKFNFFQISWGHFQTAVLWAFEEWMQEAIASGRVKAASHIRWRGLNDKASQWWWWRWLTCVALVLHDNLQHIASEVLSIQCWLYKHTGYVHTVRSLYTCHLTDTWLSLATQNKKQFKYQQCGRTMHLNEHTIINIT